MCICTARNCTQRRAAPRDAYAHWIATEPSAVRLPRRPDGRANRHVLHAAGPTHAPPNSRSNAGPLTAPLSRFASRIHEPYFGFVSFIGPHPPIAPPVPFNRLYDPDRMPNPVTRRYRGPTTWTSRFPGATMPSGPKISTTHMRALLQAPVLRDDHLYRRLHRPDPRRCGSSGRRRKHDDLLLLRSRRHARRSSWLAERILLRCVGTRPLAGELAGFRASKRAKRTACVVNRLVRSRTAAAGAKELREGVDLMPALRDNGGTRECVFGCYGVPGTPLFKVMAREGPWKYIWMANGGREQLFNEFRTRRSCAMSHGNRRTSPAAFAAESLG